MPVAGVVELDAFAGAFDQFAADIRADRLRVREEMREGREQAVLLRCIPFSSAPVSCRLLFGTNWTMRLKSSASPMVVALSAHRRPASARIGRVRVHCPRSRSIARRTSLRISFIVKPESNLSLKIHVG